MASRVVTGGEPRAGSSAYRTRPAATSSRKPLSVGKGAWPVKPPTSSTGWPESRMYSVAMATDWVATRYVAPSRCASR